TPLNNLTRSPRLGRRHAASADLFHLREGRWCEYLAAIGLTIMAGQTARRDVSKRYQRSAYLPINNPNIDMKPIPGAYQMATNNGESFVQFIANTVAPKAPARRPAAAPARAGDIGAPWRSA